MKKDQKTHYTICVPYFTHTHTQTYTQTQTQKIHILSQNPLFYLLATSHDGLQIFSFHNQGK